MFQIQRMMIRNSAYQCRRQLPSLGHPCSDFHVVHVGLGRKIHLDDHFPDVVEQAGHETDILIFDMGSLCNQGRCRRRSEGMFPQLCAIFSAPPDRSANEHAQRELLEHLHTDHNHRLPDRGNLGAMSVISGICKTQDPRRQRRVARYDRRELFRTGVVVR